MMAIDPRDCVCRWCEKPVMHPRDTYCPECQDSFGSVLCALWDALWALPLHVARQLGRKK